MTATLTRALGSRYLGVVEDAVQDALITALRNWPYRGVPEKPEAWLYSVARNRALDRLRHERLVLEKTAGLTPPAFALAEPAALLRDELPPLEDDQVGLLFLVCHPELPSESRVALALKLVGGFSVREIARAYLAQSRRWRSVWFARSERCAREPSILEHPRRPSWPNVSTRCSSRST